MPTDAKHDRQRRLLSDGAAVEVRRLGPADRAAVAGLHAALPLGDRYLRFFGVSTAHLDELADRIVGPTWTSVGAFAGDRLIGLAHYCPVPGEDEHEVAVAVAHDHHHRGVGTLLLEELVAEARAAGITSLSAEVLAVNHDMSDVLAHLGLPTRTRPAFDVRDVTISVPPIGTTVEGEHYAEVVLERTTAAEVAGLRPVLCPRSVVVVGAGHRPTSLGRLVLRRIVEGGFTGTVEVVAPHSAAVAGIPARRSIEELPAGIDLAVLCVPADAVVDSARRCGERGIRALLVLTSGAPVDALREVAALQGMRIVGPNSLGLVNTDTDVRLHADFGGPAEAGSVGLAVQSGGVAIALTDALNRLGLGVSTAVSLGDAADVGVEDLAAWWHADPTTTAAVLYLESMPDPVGFAEHTRRLAATMPVVAVRSAGSPAAVRAAASHTAASATPRAYQDAIFARSGIVAVDELDDIPALLALLTWQPPVPGRRVAIVSNAGGLGVLAADACTQAGLDVVPLPSTVQAALTAVLPAGASTANPVDATATVAPAAYTAAVDVLLASPCVDAVVALAVQTAEGDPLAGFAPQEAGRRTPLVLVRPSSVAVVDRWDLPQAAVPVFADSVPAARIIAAAARRSRWLHADRRPARQPAGIRADLIHDAVLDAVVARPAGGWLPSATAFAIGRAAGLPLVPTDIVGSATEVERRWRELGVPVAVKADAEGLVHKSASGGVHTGLDGRTAIRAAVADLRTRFGDRLRGFVVQPMIESDTELLVGVVTDPVHGSLLTVGLGGTDTDLIDDRAHCAVPPTTGDLEHLLADLRCGRRLLARSDAAAMSAAVRDTAARLAWLADRFPAIAELEVNPLAVGSDGVRAVDLRIRLAP